MCRREFHIWENSGSQVINQNVIQIGRIFNHQYLKKESINILDFYDEDSQQGKVTSENNPLVGYDWM